MLSANKDQHTRIIMGSSDRVLPATDVRGDNLKEIATLGHWQTVDESSSSDEDEILWTGNDLDSDEDFVLIPHIRTTIKPPSAARYEEVTREVIQGIASLSFSRPAATDDYPSADAKAEGRKTKRGVKPAKGNKSKHANSHSVPPPKPSAAIPAQQVQQPQVKAKRSRKRGKKERLAARKKNAKGSDPTSGNDAESRLFSTSPVESDAEVDTKYDDAVSFITSCVIKTFFALMVFFLTSKNSFLQTSAAAFHASQGTKLTFLQSLIIELGLMSPESTLPASLNSATRFLKSHAFLNLRDYLSMRHEGFDKLQHVMFKSRRALVNDLRKNKGHRQLDRTWVKDHGLSVFLVHI